MSRRTPAELKMAPGWARGARRIVTSARTARWLARRRPDAGGGIRVLLYHRITDDRDPLAVPVGRFAQQVAFLAERGYKLRRLEREHGPVRVENRAGDPAVLRAVLSWKSAQYRRTGLSDRFADERIVEVVERLLAVRTPCFGGALPVLLVDGRPVAGHVMLRRQPGLTGWFPAYDPAFSRYSPGLILRLLTARCAERAGIEVIELGREGGDYKERLKTGDRSVVETAVSRPGLVAGARWARREPERLLRAYVVQHPGLYASARRAVARIGQLRRN